jgi:pyocin large subunit-like protein
VPYTKGFLDEAELQQHYQDHKDEFGAINAQHYLVLADTFLGEPITSVTHPTTHECIRPRDNAIIRYNSATEEFGVLRQDGYIKTYFKPNPHEHAAGTNYDYYLLNCRKTKAEKRKL